MNNKPKISMIKITPHIKIKDTKLEIGIILPKSVFKMIKNNPERIRGIIFNDFFQSS